MTPDPLLVVNPRDPCVKCGNNRRKRKSCLACGAVGWPATHALRDLWQGKAAFLVCGGPSVKKIPYQRLAERGICSLGINNIAGMVPVSAMTFGDPQAKFHWGIFHDPKIIKFCPIGKLRKLLRKQMPDGTFRFLKSCPAECPNVWGFSRTAKFFPSTFFSAPYASWGFGGEHPCAPYRCIVTMLMGFRLLYYLGIRNIYMIGVDFHMEAGSIYAFDQAKTARNGCYQKTNAMLADLLPIFKEQGISVYNCNPASNCDVFPSASFDAALEKCRYPVPLEPFNLSDWYSKRILKRDQKAYPEPLRL